MTKKVIHARLATGPNKGEEILIPRIPFYPQDANVPVEMERRQFPVRLCFAMTGNKSQGQTLKKVGLTLTNDFFGHGQLYVSMSRVGNPSALSIYRPKDHPTANHMRNIVYQEVLTKAN